MFRKAVNSRTFSRRSLHGQVAHEIAMRIVSGELQPGTILSNEEAASADMEVSRTAYREALKVLSAKGLVESRPKTGTRVRGRDQWNMLDPDLLSWSFAAGPTPGFARSLFEVRQMFEPAAAAFAAERAGPEELTVIENALTGMKECGPSSDDAIQADLAFHLGILVASGNELLTSLGYLIESALAQSFALSTHQPGARENSIPLHEAVFDAIKTHRADAAREAMSHLLSEAWADIESLIADQGDGTAAGAGHGKLRSRR